MMVLVGTALGGATVLHAQTDSAALRDVKDLFNKKRNTARQEMQLALEFTYMPAAGYSLQTGFAGVVSGNLAFRAGKRADAKLSTISASFSYSQHNQSIFPVMANLWSKNGKWNYFSDWRYMNYPSTTWGLAGRSDPNDGYTIDFSYLKFHQLVHRSITKNLFVGTGIFYDKFWNISELNSEGQPLSPQELTNLRRQGLTGRDELGVGMPVRILFDSRQNTINPTQGWYVSVTGRYNFQMTSKSKSWQSLVVDVRKYIPVTASGNTLALWFYSWSSTRGTPYFLLPSTGWDDQYNMGRGYIQGRFRSNLIHYAEAEYRFRLTRNGLLGGVVFANVQSYNTNLISGAEALAPAAGAGLRIKLNKYSGANLCIDYGIGQNGSQGFFVNLGEVF
jgi:hypothetical protein